MTTSRVRVADVVDWGVEQGVFVPSQEPDAVVIASRVAQEVVSLFEQAQMYGVFRDDGLDTPIEDWSTLAELCGDFGITIPEGVDLPQPVLRRRLSGAMHVVEKAPGSRWRARLFRRGG
ncbi:hypothetical protein [Aeromicrobium sp. CnD17-E]|uniref:hypothetical protein n=1 Tax=Aeromicrobium sp. CnD17-E TaxID=2954487 RepID=UPI00209703B6|nr:hypothetical protein [Aeromicrobium sp. CnD17-E]MCO7240891.1 hypothetical protein [Aeromicrobium sp. CnD17-E]